MEWSLGELIWGIIISVGLVVFAIIMFRIDSTATKQKRRDRAEKKAERLADEEAFRLAVRDAYLRDLQRKRRR